MKEICCENFRIKLKQRHAGINETSACRIARLTVLKMNSAKEQISRKNKFINLKRVLLRARAALVFIISFFCFSLLSDKI